MYEFLTKRGTSLSFIVGLILILIYMFSVSSGLASEGYDTSTDLLALGKDTYSKLSVFDTGLMITVFLLIAATGLTILFGLLHIFKFPKQSFKAILGVVGLVAIFFIFYSSSKHEVGDMWTTLFNKFEITEGVSKIISGGIWTTLALLGGAVGIMILAEVRNMFK